MINVGTLGVRLILDDSATSALVRAGQAFESQAKRMEQVGESVSKVGRALLPVSVALSTAAVTALKFSADFERAMTKVGTITEIGVGGIKDMRKAVLELAPTVGIGPTPLAEGLLVVASTGLKGATALNVLEQSAKASAVGLGETKDIARAATAAMTAYGSENLSATEATNKLFVAVRAGGAEANEFAGTLGRVIGIAAQVGVSFDEVLASIATFTRLGVDASEATTALRGIMSTLLQPSKEAEEQLLALGTSIDGLRQSVREGGLTKALGELVRLTGDNDDALAAIIPNVRALAGVLGTAGAQGAAYAQVLGDITGATTELEDAFKVVGDTLGFKWNAAWAKAQAVLIQFGDAIAPSFVRILDAAQPLLRSAEQLAAAFTRLPGPVQSTAIAFAGLVAAAGPVLFIFGSIISNGAVVAQGLAKLFTAVAGLSIIKPALAAIQSGIFALGNSVPVLTARVALMDIAAKAAAIGLGALRGALALLTGPWGLVIAGATLLAPLLWKLVGGWDGIKSALQPVGAAFSGLLQLLKDLATLGAFLISAALQPMIDALKRAWEATKQWALGIASLAVDALRGWADSVKTFFQPAIDTIQAGFRILAGWKDKLVGIWTGFIDGAKAAVAWVHNAAEAARSLQQGRSDLPPLPGNPLKGPAQIQPVAVPSNLDELMRVAPARDALVTLTDQLAEARKSVAALTEAQRANITAGLAMGLSTEEVAKRAKVAEATVTLFSESVTKGKDALEEIKRIQDRAFGLDTIRSAEQFVSAIGGLAGVARMSRDQMTELHRSVGDAMSAMQRNGRVIPIEWTHIHDATRPAVMEAWEFVEALRAMVPPDAGIATMLGHFRSELEALHAVQSGLALPGAEDAPGLDELLGKRPGLGKALMANLSGTIKSDLGPTILGAITGGGNVGQAVGGLIGGTLTKSLMSGMTGTAVTGALKGALGSTIGGAIGSVIPGLGTMVGSMVGPLIGKLGGAIKQLFGGPSKQELEGREVAANVRKGIIAGLTPLQREQAALLNGSETWRLTIVGLQDAYKATGRTAEEALSASDRLWKAEKQGADAVKKVTEEIQGVFDEQRADVERLEAAVQRYGFTIDELGPKFKQQRLDEQARELIEDWRVLAGSGIDVSVVNERMSQAFNDYVQLVIRAGTEIPAALKPTLESLKDSGLLLDESGEKITDFEAAGIRFSETWTQGFDRVVSKLQQVIDTLQGAGKVISDLPSIAMPAVASAPQLLAPELSRGWRNGGGVSPDVWQNMIPGAADGGIVMNPQVIWAAEREPEAILPLSMLSSFSEPAPQSGGGDSRVLRSMLDELHLLPDRIGTEFSRTLATTRVRTVN